MDSVKREVAMREAKRLYPEIHPVLAGWVYDYVTEIGEAEMEKRIKEGFYEANHTEKVLSLEHINHE